MSGSALPSFRARMAIYCVAICALAFAAYAYLVNV